MHRTIITYLTGFEKVNVIDAFYLVPSPKNFFLKTNIPSFNFTSEAKLLNEPKYPIQNLEMPLLMDIPNIPVQSLALEEAEKTKTCCFL